MDTLTLGKRHQCLWWVLIIEILMQLPCYFICFLSPFILLVFNNTTIDNTNTTRVITESNDGASWHRFQSIYGQLSATAGAKSETPQGLDCHTNIHAYVYMRRGRFLGFSVSHYTNKQILTLHTLHASHIIFTDTGFVCFI